MAEFASTSATTERLFDAPKSVSAHLPRVVVCLERTVCYSSGTIGSKERTARSQLPAIPEVERMVRSRERILAERERTVRSLEPIVRYTSGIIRSGHSITRNRQLHASKNKVLRHPNTNTGRFTPCVSHNSALKQ
ncbi:MAG: hypothetical protein DMF68_05455 [Acidobacteria bacterium]|nr:MAG: hypothetical protein DMF68_05455 [Acidobacteriota bacterium]